MYMNQCSVNAQFLPMPFPPFWQDLLLSLSSHLRSTLQQSLHQSPLGSQEGLDDLISHSVKLISDCEHKPGISYRVKMGMPLLTMASYFLIDRVKSSCSRILKLRCSHVAHADHAINLFDTKPVKNIRH